MSMGTTVYKPVPVTTENSKIYDKVTATIRVTANINYLLGADEHTVALINIIKELAQYMQIYEVIIKSKL